MPLPLVELEAVYFGTTFMVCDRVFVLIIKKLTYLPLFCAADWAVCTVKLCGRDVLCLLLAQHPSTEFLCVCAGGYVSIRAFCR